MKLNSYQNFLKFMKRATIYSLALFFVIFALAEVSVLQAFCGNEALGIPPTHHSEQKQDCEDEIFLNAEYESNSEIPFVTNHNHNSEKDCPGEVECLANCSHIIVSYFGFHTNIFKVNNTIHNPNSYEITTPQSEPTDIFHPPQSA